MPSNYKLVKIIIDSKEKKKELLKETLRDRLASYERTIQVEIESLPEGDFQFIYSSSSMEAMEDRTQVGLVIERKTFPDLASSIVDGRYREQRERLLSAYPHSSICYLFEGDSIDNFSKQSKLNPASLYGAIVHLMFRDKIAHFRAISFEETINFLLSIARNYMNMLPAEHERDADYTSHVIQHAKDKFSRKKTMTETPQVGLQAMLSTIYGVSVNTAAAIASHYPTMSALIDALKTSHQTNNGDLKKMQADMFAKPTNKKGMTSLAFKNLIMTLGIH